MNETSGEKRNGSMNEQPALNLIRTYPRLYGSLASIDCGAGWFDLLDRLSMQLEAYNTAYPDAPVRALQVKEKFGGLRFYYAGMAEHPPYVAAMVEHACMQADRTCENCGAVPAVRRGGGWIRTLCDACEASRKADSNG